MADWTDIAIAWLIVLSFWLLASIAWKGIRCLVGQVQSRRWEKRLDREPCLHGIAGGKTRLRCHHCKQDNINNQKIGEAESRQREEAARILAEANRLRNVELERLTKLRTHKIDFLLSLTPEEFESIVAKMYRELNYAVEQTPMSNDFGRDLVLKKDGKTTFVECKRYAQDKLIGRPALQKFYAAIITMKADSGIFVTTSDFAETAVKFAAENRIEIHQKNLS